MADEDRPVCSINALVVLHPSTTNERIRFVVFSLLVIFVSTGAVFSCERNRFHSSIFNGGFVVLRDISPESELFHSVCRVL